MHRVRPQPVRRRRGREGLGERDGRREQAGLRLVGAVPGVVACVVEGGGEVLDGDCCGRGGGQGEEGWGWEEGGGHLFCLFFYSVVVGVVVAEALGWVGFGVLEGVL